MENANPLSSLQEKMGVLRSHYLIQLSEKIKAIDIIRHAGTEGVLSASSLSTIQTIAHQLAGGGGIYGFPTISETAGLLDHYLNNNPAPDASIIFQMMEELCRVCYTVIDKNLTTPSNDDLLNESETGKDNNTHLPLLAIFDDDPMIRLAYQIIFSGKVRLMMGKDTHDARRIMMEEKPALVLLDDIMPGGPTGIGYLESIKTDPVLSSIPVIMVTASNTKENMLRGLAAGAIDYIVKPFAPDMLVDLVMKILMRKQNHIVLALADTKLAHLLGEKLLELQCHVDDVSETLETIDSTVWGDKIIVFDSVFAQHYVQSANTTDAKNAWFIFVGNEHDLPPEWTKPPSLVIAKDRTTDGLVRDIGMVLAARKKQTPP